MRKSLRKSPYGGLRKRHGNDTEKDLRKAGCENKKQLEVS
jgi:hypothetical protein